MPKFQSFWYGDSLSPYQRLAMKSFVDRGHAYDLYTYKAIDAPAGVVLRDAEEILPQSRVFFYGERAGAGRGSVAGFANLFRYHLLHQRGNWWVDADVVCMSETVPSAEVFMGWEYDDLVGNAILKFPAQHWFVDELAKSSERAGQDLAWGTTGPNLITRLVSEKNLLASVTPQAEAYPLQSMEALHLLVPARRAEVQARIGGKPFLHLWNEILRRAVVLPWMAPPRDSLLSDLFDRHGVDFGDAPRYTADQIQRLSDNYYASATWSHPYAETGEIGRLHARMSATQMRMDGLADDIARLRTQVQELLISRPFRWAAFLRRAAAWLRGGRGPNRDDRP